MNGEMSSPDPTNPYAPPQAVVHDVIDPNAPLTPADRGSRLGAAVLDSIIVMLMVYLPGGLGVLVGAFQGEGRATLPMVAGFSLATIGFIVWVYLTAVNVKRSGQSLAKKMFNIRVVRSNGEPVSLSRVFWLRNVVNTLLSAIPLIGFIYGLADILFIFTDTRQCLHDKLADTIVVRA